MDRIIDEIVKVSVKDAIASATVTSLNTAAVVGVTDKDGAKTQVAYDQNEVEEAYETGEKRVIFIEPTLSGTLASGDVELECSGNVVATAKIKTGDNASTVRTLVKALASDFNSGKPGKGVPGYKAVASATRLTITSDAYGATASEDGVFSIDYNSTGFSGSPNNTDGVEGADIVKVTKAFFQEEANPGKLVCIPVAADPSGSDIADILEEALEMGKDDNHRDIDFYNVIIRLGSGATSSSVVSLAVALDEWCGENFRFGHIDVQDRAVAEDAIAALVDYNITRVAIYFHLEESGKVCGAAIVADRCGNDPAKGTWALKTLDSLVADPTTKANFKDAQSLGLNIYAKVSGVDCLYFGTVCAPDKFIDSVMKKDWMKFNAQIAIFDALRKGNNGDGITFDDAGINDVVTALTSVGTKAADKDHQYIMDDVEHQFEVEAPKYKDIPKEDVKVRNLPKVKMRFSIMDFIHTVKTVELQVVE